MSESTQTPTAWSRPGGAWASGTVTSPGVPPLVPPPPAPPEPPGADGPGRRRRQMMIFGGIAGAILAVGLVVILIVALSSEGNPFGGKAAAPADLRPPLAQMCPAPTVAPSAEPTGRPSAPVPAVPGERTTDPEAGISYKKYGAPWVPWDTTWRAGTLEVPYRVGQHFVTEQYSGGSYHASILSAAVPAADNDAVTVDLKCVGRQVAADVRAEYYPQPNTVEPLRDEMTTLGGRPAWVSEFRLHFTAAGLTATDELSAVAVIDVGKPTAAVLYVSIPGTHKQFDPVIDDVLQSVRPL
ncbi:hypothetical protein [Actinoplanes nipponensis]|nr:hypothetical protein [Actinoplanes nipponensis]